MSCPVLIGVTLDAEPAGGYSKYPWYALRENYASAVVAAGGVPLMLPHEPELAAVYAEEIDGLIVTGGAFDVDPALFGAGQRHETVTTKTRRTAFEWRVTAEMLSRDRPILGICGGEQLLNVVLGGTLIQHIPDAVPDALEHEQENPRHEPGHEVSITPGTLLHAIVGGPSLAVNSAHHQAVERTGPDVRVNAVAPDGVIEGIEAVGRRFCLGVQWHPEFAISAADAGLMRALVEAAGHGR